MFNATQYCYQAHGYNPKCYYKDQELDYLGITKTGDILPQTNFKCWCCFKQKLQDKKAFSCTYCPGIFCKDCYMKPFFEPICVQCVRYYCVRCTPDQLCGRCGYVSFKQVFINNWTEKYAYIFIVSTSLCPFWTQFGNLHK